MPGSRRRGLSLRPPALRRRSGEEQLTLRRAELLAEEGTVEGGAGRGLPAGEAACSPRAAEPCLHKTPKRSLRRKSRIPIFSSPINDNETQQEIFWDSHSPIGHRPGSGKTKQSTSRCAVEISEIVNRIAPQDEKAACNEGSLLGTWIGEDAIPCTPVVVKGRARTKLSCTSGLKIKNPEEELMKLAKEFDKNLVELDALQVQEKLGHNFIQTASEPSSNSKDEINMKNQKSLLGEWSETDTAVSLKPIGQNTGIPVAQPGQSSSQKSVDLEAEVALRALFDSSTQKCSGQLSQGLSDISLNNSFHKIKSTLKEETLPEKVEDTQHGNSEAYQKDALFAVGSMNQTVPKPDTDTLTKNPLYLKTQLVASAQPAGVVIDDFDDWDTDLFADDSFVMQITQNPELISTEEPPQIPANLFVHDFSDASRTKQRNSGNSVTFLGTVNKYNGLQYSSLKHSSKNSQNVVKSLSSQKPCKTETKVLHGKCDVKADKMKSVWKSAQNSDLNQIPVSMQSEMKKGNDSTKPKSDALPLFPSRSNPHRQPAGKPGNNTHTISCQSSNVSTIMKPNDLTKVVNQANASHSNQVEIPKKCPLSFDDWNEPKFSDEILDMFCGSDSLWDANYEDDELLYQVCDDIEKQTQSQDVKQGNEKTKTIQEASISSRSNADNSFPVSKQGLPDLLLAQKTNAKQEAPSLNDSCRNSSKTVHGLATTGHAGDCKNISNPQSVISDPSVGCKYALPKNCHQDASKDTAKTISGKWYRSNSVPAGERDSEVSPVNAVNISSRKALDSSHFLHNAGKIPSSSSGNKTSLVPSKFKFRKINNINNSPGALRIGSENPGSHSGVGITLQSLEGNKNQVNVTLHSKLDNKKSPFKRHLSESFAQATSVSVVEQKNRKCSQEEIERKKQEALARRKSRTQAIFKDA